MSRVRRRFYSLALLVLLAGCAASLGGSPDTPPNPLTGTWKGTDQLGQTMELTLHEDGRMALQISGARGNFRKRGTYAVDLSHDPPHLDITLNDRPTIHTVCKITDGRRLTFENVNSCESRPRDFSSRQVVLQRQ
jgi:hypothetical protein